MRRGVFGAGRRGRVGWSVPRAEGFSATFRSLSPARRERRKSVCSASFCPVSNPKPPSIFGLTLRPCHGRHALESPVHVAPGNPSQAHHPPGNDTFVTSALQACHADVTPLSCEKNLWLATPCESRVWLVTSCIERKLPPFRPRNTPVGFAAICSICRIMKPRNCPADLLLRAAHGGVCPRLTVPRACAFFARDFRGTTA